MGLVQLADRLRAERPAQPEDVALRIRVVDGLDRLALASRHEQRMASRARIALPRHRSGQHRRSRAAGVREARARGARLLRRRRRRRAHAPPQRRGLRGLGAPAARPGRRLRRLDPGHGARHRGRDADPGGAGRLSAARSSRMARPGMARAAAAAGTVLCLSSLTSTRPAEVAEAAPDGKRWMQVYLFRDRGVTRAMVEEAAESGLRGAPAHRRRALRRPARARPAQRLPGPGRDPGAGDRGRGRPPQPDHGRGLRARRSLDHLEGPRAALRRVRPADPRQGPDHRRGRGARRRARRRRRGGLEPRRAPARQRARRRSTRCRRWSRPSTAGSRSCSTAGCGAGPTWRSPSRSGRRRCSSAAPRSGAWRSMARRVPGAPWRSSPRSCGSRSPCSALPSPSDLGADHVQRTAPIWRRATAAISGEIFLVIERRGRDSNPRESY